MSTPTIYYKDRAEYYLGKDVHSMVINQLNDEQRGSVRSLVTKFSIPLAEHVFYITVDGSDARSWDRHPQAVLFIRKEYADRSILSGLGTHRMTLRSRSAQKSEEHPADEKELTIMMMKIKIEQYEIVLQKKNEIIESKDTIIEAKETIINSLRREYDMLMRTISRRSVPIN